MSEHNKNGFDATSIFLAIFGPMLIFGLLWYIMRPQIMSATFTASYYQFLVYTHIAWLIPDDVLAKMSQFVYHLPNMAPEKYGFKTFTELWGLCAYGLRILFIPLLAWWLYRLHGLGKSASYHRKLKRDQVVAEMAKYFPNLPPIVGENIHKLPLHCGPWRIAASYIHFACAHQLLLYKGCEIIPKQPWSAEEMNAKLKKKRQLLPDHPYLTLNIEKCDEVFTKQLGPRWTGFNTMPDHWKALCGICAARIAGGKEGRKASDQVLQQIANSYSRKGPNDRNNGQVFTLDAAPGIELLEQYKGHEDVKEVVDKHGFNVTIVMALLDVARLKGKLPCNQFIWLRPMDRGLWYALQCVGGRTAFVEAGAPWAHYKAEMYIKEAISVPAIESATDALEVDLITEEWISSPEDVYYKRSEVAA